MLSHFSRSFLLGTAIALTAVSCRTPTETKADEASASSAAESAATIESLGTLSYDGDQAALVALDRAIAAADRNSQKLTALTERLVALLNQTTTTPAARQAIAQRLGVLLAGDVDRNAASAARDALARMLADDAQVELARLGLDRVPGDIIDAVFLEALPKSTGRAQLAIVQSLGTRRVAAAVPALTALANDSDTHLAAAAVHALGEIGGSAAIAAIRAAKDIDAKTRTDALLHAARTLPPREASTFYSSVLGGTQRFVAQMPEGQTTSLGDSFALENDLTDAQRATATRGLLANDRAGAGARVVEILAGSDWTQKEVALEIVRASDPKEIVPALAQKLSSFDPATQIAVLAALQEHAHPAARRAVVAAASHPNGEVRAAAIAALGHLPGEASTARLLAEIIADDSPSARTARQSLARLSGPGVADAVVAGAKEGAPGTRAVFIEQLALRYMPETVPQLLAMRTDSNSAVRLAAVAALGELGGAAQQQALLDWTIDATDAAEQSRALRAFVTLTLRLPNEDTRGAPLFAALDQAPPAVAVKLLPALPRLGGAAAAACAARLAVREDPVVAEAAANTLARWPDRKALLPLLDVAEKATDSGRRATAERTAVQWLERNREPWTREHTTVVSRLLTGASDDQVRQRLLVVLRRANDDDALALAEKLRAQPAFAAQAEETLATIRANLVGSPTFKASGSTGSLRYLIDNRPGTYWSVATNPDQWLEIDFRTSRPLHRLEMDHGERAEDIPEKFDVFVTDDVEKPGTARVSGNGTHAKTVIEFPAGTRGRFVIIKHTGERREGSWAISELFVD